MKHFVLFLAISLVAISSFGQTTFKRNDIYLEAGGNGLTASVNYERQLTRQPGLGLRVGLGFYPEKGFYLTVPISLNYLFELKKERSFVEAGLGTTWTGTAIHLFGGSNNSNKDIFVNFVPSVGYRRHTNKNVL